LADDVEKDFPKASNIVRHFMYVDDVLAGANSIQEAQLAISELHHAFNRAGFPLRKWTANQESILEDIPNEHLLHDDFRDLNSESFAKTLGVRWNATSDEFYFVPPPVLIESPYTQREVHSEPDGCPRLLSAQKYLCKRFGCKSWAGMKISPQK